jgi:hypothetical protein
VTTGTELLAKGKVGVDRELRKTRDTSHPRPHPCSCPLLRSGPCPERGCATPRAARAPLRVPCRASGAPHTPARAAPRHPPARPGGSLPTFPGAAGEAAAVAATGPGSPGDKRSDSPGASTDPALSQAQDPEARGARLPNAPLPEAGERGGLRRPPSTVPLATALSRSCPAPGGVSGRGWQGGGCYSRLKGEEETETGTAAAA